ncbi:MAG: UDP-glucose 4-epimerase [Deltaproteobacteria bacterium RIFCSPLOWO2_12_FULL_42_16]|nr:MAG: UDP-glucose 4-epimerase [Deltaproteobacteria bacterium GWD2_42_10]OGQ67559.1 MAG: UDP-glucose 4-epimerase [Deltaproteobacteria bacterium RIFCSPLOWO2_12_FULL_42_16]
MKRILVTGATGQIGSELVPALRKRYGSGNVIATGHKTQPDKELLEGGLFFSIDVRDFNSIEKVVREFRVDTIYHLAALLSSAAEKDPQLAWDVNMNGLRNILEAARKFQCSVFFPSSIGAFGPSTPPDNTPQDTIQRPTTIYGIAKVTGELLCDYYFHKFGVDTRGLRFPGLISYRTMPRGGTTDYAVEIFYAAIREKRYECFLKQGTHLDMMFMPDAIRAAIELMDADSSKLIHRNAFNITAMSLAPEDIYAEIKKHTPEFTMTYKIDPVRQAIADSWPHRMDDSAARTEWNWKPEYDLATMTREMIEKLSISR